MAQSDVNKFAWFFPIQPIQPEGRTRPVFGKNCYGKFFGEKVLLDTPYLISLNPLLFKNIAYIAS